jgi:hypothetical protein
MKTFASIGFGIASAVAVCVGAASVASLVLANPEGHSFKNMSGADLWTVQPVKVDRSAQNYERLPAVLSSYATSEPKIRVASTPTVPGVSTEQAQSAPSSEHLTWCKDRYRSYDAQTNSYRAFTGEVRTCTSPFDSMVPTASVSQPGTNQTEAPDSVAVSWCAARYQSYRAQDNTYQPFEGPRKTCDGPRASNDVASRW